MAKTTAELADDTRLEREKLLLEKETLELDEVREQVAERKAVAASRKTKSRIREMNMANAVSMARQLAAKCSHKQGGQNGNMFKGKGPTALKVETMPDGFTVRIHCLNCPLRITSPIPSDAGKKQKPGESQGERNERLARFARDKERFDRYYAMSQEDALSVEAAAPMECGTTFKVTDEEGNQVFRPRPSDAYAMEMAEA